MTALLSLFRGINVGGKQKVKMSDLKDLHETLGLRDVATYIQSGNVVFTSDAVDRTALPQQIADGFAQRFGFRADVVVRTADEMRAIIARNPFQHQPAKEPKWITVMFLQDSPTEAARQDLLTTYGGPEEIHISDKEMYAYYTAGIGESKLTMPLITKKLKTSGTARNWNTVTKLMDLLIARDGRPS